jgi:adenylate cyclase
MGATPVKRKLAAILAADAVGYSKMMAANEEKTLKVLSAHRAVIDGIIEFHEGRIVGTAGDSVLAEFGSPVEAVRCAVEIQDALKTRNEALPEADRMLFRVGVNLGDVIAKDDDILGDGVNIAARLESIAEPGGICVSSSVYEQIAGKLDLGFIDIGAQSLKNIMRPIQVYRIERGLRAPGAPSMTRAPRGGRSLRIVAGAIVSLAAAATIAWTLDYIPGLPSPQRVKAEAALARQRADAEEAQRQAQAEAEKQRVAKSRAAADSELARFRAEAEAARRKASELAAAEEARRAAEAALKARAAPPKAAPPSPPRTAVAAASPAPALAPAATPTRVAAATNPAPAPARSYDGQWQAQFNCSPYAGRPAFASTVQLSVAGNEFRLDYGDAGKPGSFQVSGIPKSDGQLQLSGKGLVATSKKPQPYRATFDGRFDAGRFEGKGSLGAQPCALSMSRAP